MKVMRKIIEIDKELCDGCGNCVLACDEKAIQIINNKAEVVKDMYCDGIGACIGECPQGALTLVEREADEFDETAVEAHLASLNDQADGDQAEKNKSCAPLACGCPSASLSTFDTAGSSAPRPAETERGNSCLGHWPVQIRLIPPHAPFLKNADLVVAADCVPVALPSFHRDFLSKKAVMIGCPKFDDTNDYLERFIQIFKTCGIKSVTVLLMEVPCCSGLPGLVKKALAESGKDIPLREIVVSARGEIV